MATDDEPLICNGNDNREINVNTGLIANAPIKVKVTSNQMIINYLSPNKGVKKESFYYGTREKPRKYMDDSFGLIEDYAVYRFRDFINIVYGDKYNYPDKSLGGTTFHMSDCKLRWRNS